MIRQLFLAVMITKNVTRVHEEWNDTCETPHSESIYQVKSQVNPSFYLAEIASTLIIDTKPPYSFEICNTPVLFSLNAV